MSKCKAVIEDLNHGTCFPCKRMWNPDVQDLPCLAGKYLSDFNDDEIDAYGEYMQTLEELREEQK